MSSWQMTHNPKQFPINSQISRSPTRWTDPLSERQSDRRPGRPLRPSSHHLHHHFFCSLALILLWQLLQTAERGAMCIPHRKVFAHSCDVLATNTIMFCRTGKDTIIISTSNCHIPQRKQSPSSSQPSPSHHNHHHPISELPPLAGLLRGADADHDGGGPRHSRQFQVKHFHKDQLAKTTSRVL